MKTWKVNERVPQCEKITVSGLRSKVSGLSGRHGEDTVETHGEDVHLRIRLCIYICAPHTEYNYVYLKMV